jgi:hypothetical protein
MASFGLAQRLRIADGNRKKPLWNAQALEMEERKIWRRIALA